jgi:hypothetical protein
MATGEISPENLTEDERINNVKGSCSLCASTIYKDDTGFIEYRGSLFCTTSCAQEATGDKIETGTVNNIGEYECPYCYRILGYNEGSSVTLENGTIIIGCPYCERESIYPVI